MTGGGGGVLDLLGSMDSGAARVVACGETRRGIGGGGGRGRGWCFSAGDFSEAVGLVLLVRSRSVFC